MAEENAAPLVLGVVFLSTKSDSVGGSRDFSPTTPILNPPPPGPSRSTILPLDLPAPPLLLPPMNNHWPPALTRFIGPVAKIGSFSGPLTRSRKVTPFVAPGGLTIWVLLVSISSGGFTKKRRIIALWVEPVPG